MECCFTDLFTGIPLTIHEQASIMAAQPSPFPSLMIHQATNTMVVLHGITMFYPPLGVLNTHHPATGATILLLAKQGSQLLC